MPESSWKRWKMVTLWSFPWLSLMISQYVVTSDSWERRDAVSCRASTAEQLIPDQSQQLQLSSDESETLQGEDLAAPSQNKYPRQNRGLSSVFTAIKCADKNGYWFTTLRLPKVYRKLSEKWRKLKTLQATRPIIAPKVVEETLQLTSKSRHSQDTGKLAWIDL